MRKFIALMLIAGLVISFLPGIALASQEKNKEMQQVALQAQEKNKPAPKEEIRLVFKGVVVAISGKVLDVVLVEPFAKAVAKRLEIGPVLKVNCAEAEVFKVGTGKVDFSEIKVDSWVAINGIYNTTKKTLTAKSVHIILRPPGRVIGVGVVKSKTADSFTLEMKPKKGETAPVLRVFKVTPKTIFYQHGVGEVTFDKLTVGANAAVKGFLNNGTWFALFVAFKPAP